MTLFQAILIITIGSGLSYPVKSVTKFLDGSVTIISSDTSADTFEANIVNILLENLQTVQIFHTDRAVNSQPNPSNNFILITQNETSLSILLNWFDRIPNFDPRGKFLLIMPSTEKETVRSALQILWRHEIHNVAVMSDDSLFTWYPYDKNSECGEEVVPKKWNFEEEIKSPFERKVPNNLHGCKLKASWAYHPMATRDPKDRNPG